MTSGAVLIYGSTITEREKKVVDLIKKVDESLLDKENADLLVVKKEKGKGSIGIAQVRAATNFLSTRPYAAKAKIVVIYGAHDLTIQAQNALLKTLEEPPIYAVVILSSKTETALLPTVLSRCRKYKAEGMVFSVTAEIEEYNLEKIESLGVGERLDMAQELAKEDKEEILQVLEGIVRDLRTKMLSSTSSKYAVAIKKILSVIKDIEDTNVNTRLALENVFILI